MSTEGPNGSSVSAALAPLPEGTHCPGCGYDLRGSTSPRCPECAFALERLRSAESQIPWIHRRQIGWLRAYWRTAWMVTFHTRKFCAEAARPVSYADAQRFRWATVTLAFVTMLLCGFAHWLANEDALQPVRTIEWLVIPIEIAVLLTFSAWTGVPSYFFHPRRAPLALQNRAVALSYYATAPLGCLPLVLLPLVLVCARTVVDRFVAGVDIENPVPIPLAGLALAVALVLCWGNLVRVASNTLRRRTTTGLVACVMPLIALLVGGLLLVGLPALTFYVAIVFYTVR